MPRSFLISKLHTWRDNRVVEDGLESDEVTHSCLQRLDDDQVAQVQDLSTAYDYTTKIKDVADKKPVNENHVADFIGTSSVPT